MKNLVRLSVAAFLMAMATSCCNCKKDEKCEGAKPCKSECVCPSEADCPKACDDKCERPFPKDRKDMKKGHRHHGMRKMHHRDMNPEHKAQFEKWMNFDSLSVDEQKALIAERKAAIDKREAEIAAIKAEKKARMEEIKKKWENFDNLSIEEQKELIDMKSFKFRHARHMHPGDKRPACGNDMRQCGTDKRPCGDK